MSIIKLDENTFRGDNDNRRVKFDYPEIGKGTFYVRFFDDEDLREFQETIECYERRYKANCPIKVTIDNGTYKVESTISICKTCDTVWDILMHKYKSLSNQVRTEPDTQREYYSIIFSFDKILPCAKKYAI